jgi:hypothetical protein
MGTVSRAISCALAASSFLALAAVPAGVLPDAGRNTSVPTVVTAGVLPDGGHKTSVPTVVTAGVLPDGGRKTSVPAVVAVALTSDAVVAPDSPRNI